MKGLDHIVICVKNLDAAASDFAQLGFTVTPRAKHPFGTHNQLIQLDGFFLELLSVVEPEKLPEPVTDGFSFALFNQFYLNQREGISMLVLDSDDFRADHTAAKNSGLKTYDPFEFSRATTLPDGSTGQVSFGLNFVTNEKMPMAGFFSCQQFNPENFWFEQYQQHANTAININEVCIVAENPAEISTFVAGLAHSEIQKIERSGLKIPTVRGDITVRTPKDFEDRFATNPPDVSNGALIAGIVVGLKNIATVSNRVVNLHGMSVLFEEKD